MPFAFPSGTRGYGFRVALGYASAFAVGALLLFAASWWLISTNLATKDRKDTSVALSRLSRAYGSGGVAGLKREIRVLRATGRYGWLVVRAANLSNRTLMADLPPTLARFPPPVFEQEAARPGEWSAPSDEATGTVLEMKTVAAADGILLQAGRSTRDRERTLSRYFSSAMRFLLPFLLAGSVAAGFIGRRQGLRPVRGLIAAVREVRGGHPGARVPVDGPPDEIGQLARSVNEMLERIDGLVAGMRDSLDHVAHELRTPLARLRAAAEGALREGTAPERQAEALAECVEEADRTLAVLSSLMDIAEAGAGTIPLRRESVDLGSIAGEAAGLFGPAAEEKGVSLSVIRTAPVPVMADARRISQVVANLLDNAIKYTPRGGRIDVEARTVDGGGVLEIRDTGIGIFPEDLPHVWDRLYRGRQAAGIRGAGIGLSLVRALVEAHGGTVGARTPAAGGSEFTIRLPSG